MTETVINDVRSKRVTHQRDRWFQLELLPRVRLQWMSSGLGLGLGWLPWWVHIWLWRVPAKPPAPPAPIGDRWYVCDDHHCKWSGRLEDSVHPKHETEFVLCPQCHETVTWYEPHPFVEVEYGCHECGLPEASAVHAGQGRL